MGDPVMVSDVGGFRQSRVAAEPQTQQLGTTLTVFNLNIVSN